MPGKPKREHGAPLEVFSREEIEAMRRAQLSRRRFVTRAGGVAVVTAAGVAIMPGVAGTQDEAQPGPPFEYTFEGVPHTPDEPPSDELQVLTEEEAAVVEALTARVLPGTPVDPGAREAGVVHYIDHLLSYNSGIHEATYLSGPFARTYEGDTPPAEDDETTIWVRADEIHRYGYQSPLSPLQVYQIAIPLVQEHARQRFGRPVEELDESEQDDIIWDLLDEAMEGFDQFSPIAFFQTLRRHTSEGMFSDPAYGGNRDLVGWTLVGFPGAQRGYAPQDLLREGEPRPPQAMSEMPHFNPGVTQPGDGPEVVQPVREGEDDDDGS